MKSDLLHNHNPTHFISPNYFSLFMDLSLLPSHLSWLDRPNVDLYEKGLDHFCGYATCWLSSWPLLDIVGFHQYEFLLSYNLRQFVNSMLILGRSLGRYCKQSPILSVSTLAFIGYPLTHHQQSWTCYPFFDWTPIHLSRKFGYTF